ncbi:PIG-L family deacetylase [Streptomyces pactum]|uniref:PIG-L family deacetylase n=1 Tax=Streptomyces pactum TaxID=68249 RepID=A0ABS0NJP7_9ACTN|nr:PIG-L family deacetylase [Streptomyces pactum]MBH5335424.1 PIG-L family deacetylase [Streptomyces pactum]
MPENSSPRGAAARHTTPSHSIGLSFSLTRRRTLAALAAVTAGTAVSCTGGSATNAATPAPVRSVDPLGAEPFTPVTGDRSAVLMQVVAHPDDDLYFMTPDSQHLLRAGARLVCVYVTAGESLGINRPPGAPIPEPDRSAYSAARHQGLRQAYAEMLGMDRFTRWQRSVTELPGGLRAETNRLVSGARQVELIFLNIAMLSAGRVRLPHLWEIPGVTARTLVAEGSPVREVQSYRHETLVDVLADLMDRYRPTVIHTLDPDPDYQVHDAFHPRDNDQPGCSDHRDHTPVALFTWKAMSQWVADASRRDGRAPRFLTTAFRGYYNQRWPFNLPPAVVGRKARLLEAYGGAPDWPCGNPAGCGDYSQGNGGPLRNRKGWIRSTHHRYPGALPAPVTDHRGNLVAYGVLGTQAVQWRETSPGSGRFGAPRNLGGGPLAPTLSAVRDTTGRQLLFGLRFSALEGQGQGNARDIVVLEEISPGGAFGGWHRLGTPHDDPEDSRRVGAPVAVATPDGRVHLFVRTAGKGLATRVRDAGGNWGGWVQLGGGEIQDGLTVLVDRDRLVHVFGAGRDTVHHWAQRNPDGAPLPVPDPGLPVPAHRPGAVLTTDGAIALVYRTPADPQPRLYTLNRRGDGPHVTPLRHFDGYGPVAAHPVPVPGRADQVLLAGTSIDGEVLLRYGTGTGTRPLCSPGRLVPVGTPAVLPGGPDSMCVVGMAPGATPWIWRPAPTTPA